MSNIALSNFLNMLKVYNQNKASVLKIRFSKKYLKVLDIFLKEGFIRGYFLAFENEVQMIYILLKYTSNTSEFFNYKVIKFTEEHKYKNIHKNQRNDFNLVIGTNGKSPGSKKNICKFNITGQSIIKVY